MGGGFPGFALTNPMEGPVAHGGVAIVLKSSVNFQYFTQYSKPPRNSIKIALNHISITLTLKLPFKTHYSHSTRIILCYPWSVFSKLRAVKYLFYFEFKNMRNYLW